MAKSTKKSATSTPKMAIAGLPQGSADRLLLRLTDSVKYRHLKYREDLLAAAAAVREARAQHTPTDLLDASEAAEAALLQIRPEDEDAFEDACFELSQATDRINPLRDQTSGKRFRNARKLKKIRKHLIAQSRHRRKMHEDIMPPEVLETAHQAERVFKATNPLDSADFNAAAHRLHQAGRDIVPQQKSAWRENVEIMVVAIAVALGVRTYIVQPFKIPTGSMQPTLYGVTHGAGEDPGKLFHPLGSGRLSFANPGYLIRGLFTGKWWTNVTAQGNGIVKIPDFQPNNKFLRLDIGFKSHEIPYGFTLQVKNGDVVKRGDILANGNKESGDQILVNKIAYNYGRPKRGDIFVFNVRDVNYRDMLGSDQHYIKRLVGLPGETIQVLPDRRLYADGELINEPESIRNQYQRVYSGAGRGQTPTGFSGYKSIPANHDNDSLSNLPRGGLAIELSDTQYLPMGDNTMNSQDGRYFGGVERKDVTGPAFMVYWPFPRFGLTDTHADAIPNPEISPAAPRPKE